MTSDEAGRHSKIVTPTRLHLGRQIVAQQRYKRLTLDVEEENLSSDY